MSLLLALILAFSGQAHLVKHEDTFTGGTLRGQQHHAVDHGRRDGLKRRVVEGAVVQDGREALVGHNRHVAKVVDRLAHPASIKPIRLQVCCDTVLSTADVRVIVHTQSDPRNVAVTLEIDGPAYWTYSELPLNGEHSPATFQVRYPRLPEGSYTITVVLWRHELKTYEAGRATASVRIGAIED